MEGYKMTMQTIKIEYAEYQDMMRRVTEFASTHEGRLPNYVDYKQLRIPKEEYLDAQRRVEAFPATHSGRLPRTVKVTGTPLTMPLSDKTNFLRSMADAVGSKFNSFTELYNLIKGRGYGYYYNDRYSQADAVARLKSRAGLNCSDICQLMAQSGKDMGYTVRFVHVICLSGTGHIQIDIKGREFGDKWKRCDPAAALKSSYFLGNLWCSSGRVISYDDAWLISDDGRT
jgi:hypothetical protein